MRRNTARSGENHFLGTQFLRGLCAAALQEQRCPDRLLHGKDRAETPVMYDGTSLQNGSGSWYDDDCRDRDTVTSMVTDTYPHMMCRLTSASVRMLIRAYQR